MQRWRGNKNPEWASDSRPVGSVKGRSHLWASLCLGDAETTFLSELRPILGCGGLTLTARRWAELLSRDRQLSRERVLLCLHSTVRVAVRQEVWRRYFRDFGGIGFKRGLEIQLVPRSSGGPCVQVPEWVSSQLQPSRGDSLCITQRGDDFFLKKLQLVSESSDVPGCTVMDSFTRRTVTRHCALNADLEQINQKRLATLSASLGSFPRDPVKPLVKAEEQIGLLARRELLGRWNQSDQTLARRYRQEALCDQQPDGSWADSSAITALRLIRLLNLGANRRTPGVIEAANWLLESTEPAGFPGMFMFDEETVQRFNQWRASHSGSDRTEPKPTPTQVEAFLESVDLLGVSNSFCELKLTWTTAAVTEALLRLGFAEHPRVIRAIHTQLALRRGGRWCGCGNYQASRGVRTTEGPLDFNHFPVSLARPKRNRVNTTDWPTKGKDALGMDCTDRYESRAAGSERAVVFRLPSLGSGDCTFAVHRGLAWHPDYPGSSLETLAALEWEYRQGWDGSWTGNSPSFVFNCLSLLTCPLAGFVVLRSVPLLIRTQDPQGFWSEGPDMAHQGWARSRPRLPCPSAETTTLAICRALRRFGFLDKLRP